MSDEPNAPVADPVEPNTGITGDAGDPPAAPPADPPAPAGDANTFSLYGDEGPNEEILGQLPKSLQPLVSKYKNAEELDKGIDHLKFMAKGKGYEPLAPDADEATIAKHNEIMRNVNNVPETPDGYKFDKPESYSDEEWEAAGDSVNGYLGVLHKHNASPALVNDLMGQLGESMAAAKEQLGTQAEDHRKQQIDAANQKWGGETEKMMQNANRVADTFELPRNQIQSVEMVAFLNNVKAALSEDKLGGNDDGEVLGGSEDYSKQADAIMNDPNNPFYADYHSGDREREMRASAEQTRLLALHHKQKGKQS
jgi:hypothetical protein